MSTGALARVRVFPPIMFALCIAAGSAVARDQKSAEVKRIYGEVVSPKNLHKGSWVNEGEEFTLRSGALVTIKYKWTYDGLNGAILCSALIGLTEEHFRLHLPEQNTP